MQQQPGASVSDLRQAGQLTFLTRVECWELDFNNHWNTRFYARSFQQAAESGGPGRPIAWRTMRFHHELLAGAPVELRTARLEGGPLPGAVVHLLWSDDTLSAIAVDPPETGSDTLPALPADRLAAVMPRRMGPMPAATDHPPAPATDLGTIRPTEVDHTGNLLFEEVIRRTATGTHHLMNHLGHTPQFITDSGIGRMLVEILVDRQGRCGAGERLHTRARLASVGSRSIVLDSTLETAGGRLVATVSKTVVAVDLNTRKPTALPDFFRDAIVR